MREKWTGLSDWIFKQIHMYTYNASLNRKLGYFSTASSSGVSCSGASLSHKIGPRNPYMYYLRKIEGKKKEKAKSC